MHSPFVAFTHEAGPVSVFGSFSRVRKTQIVSNFMDQCTWKTTKAVIEDTAVPTNVSIGIPIPNQSRRHAKDDVIIGVDGSKAVVGSRSHQILHFKGILAPNGRIQHHLPDAIHDIGTCGWHKTKLVV